MKTWAFSYCLILITFYRCCDAQNYFEQCLAESGVAKEKSVVNMNDPQLQCFDTCVFKKRGILNNGKIDATSQFDALKRSYSGSLSTLKDLVDSCAATANGKKDECEVVNAMKKCVAEKIKV